jgi:hypothetical protein
MIHEGNRTRRPTSGDQKLTPLTDVEFKAEQLPESFRGFAFWDEEGYLITIHCHAEALKQLMPRHENT